MVTSAQLAAAGLSRPAIAKRVTVGRLHPKYRGVYAVGHPKLSQEGEWLAAVLAVGEGAALGRLAAASLLEIWRRQVNGIDVIAPTRRRARQGFHVHACRGLDPRDVTIVRGIPVTTVARTLVDLTDVLDWAQLANVIHEAAFRKRFDPRATRAAMARAAGRRRLGDGHTRPRTRREDKARDRALRATGREVLRLTGLDLTARPDDVLARLEAASVPCGRPVARAWRAGLTDGQTRAA